MIDDTFCEREINIKITAQVCKLTLMPANCTSPLQFYAVYNKLRVRFFGRIRKRICDLRSFGSCRIKGTDESLSRVDSSVPLMRHDPNDLRSQIRFRILPKKRTLSVSPLYQFSVTYTVS